MSFTVIDVQQATASLVTSVQTPVFAADPVTGDFILVGVSTWDAPATATHSAPTDTEGNLYVQLGPTTPVSAIGSARISLWVAVGVTGGSSFRVTSHHTTAYGTAIAWCVRPSAAVMYSAAVSEMNCTNNGNNDPVGATVGESFVFCIADANGDNQLSEGTGWNTTGVNGFTAGMKTNAKYGLASVTVGLYTEYQIASGAVAGHWVDPNDTNTRAVIITGVSAGIQPPPKHPTVRCEPQTLVSSPAKNAGCNTGGLGWTPEYTGASGVVPIGAEPPAGETLTGKRSLYVWGEITHVNY